MDAIVGVSTALGIGGIGIIRMSGKDTFNILEKIFVPKAKEKIEKIKGYSIKYGHVVEEEQIIDEVLVSYFKAPKSYTTEDMCEINSHGGTAVTKRILELCLKNGASSVKVLSVFNPLVILATSTMKICSILSSTSVLFL